MAAGGGGPCGRAPPRGQGAALTPAVSHFTFTRMASAMPSSRFPSPCPGDKGTHHSLQRLPQDPPAAGGGHRGLG